LIWIISGTQDGREIGAKLADREIKKSPEKRQEILMTVVSQYGKVLAAHKGIDVEVGRFKQQDMVRIIKEKHITLVLDASHPYAAIVSETARSACKETDVDYVRFERPEISLPDYDKLYHVKDEFEAAEMAGELGKSILLTTGSKTLAAFVHAEALKGKEIWVRVLPVSGVIKLCEDLGMKAKYILAMQGPFSYEMNLAMIHDYEADVMVTKNSGLVGGSDTKLKAAMDAGISVIVIDKPVTDLSGFPVFSTQQDILNYMEEYYGFY